MCKADDILFCEVGPNLQQHKYLNLKSSVVTVSFSHYKNEKIEEMPQHRQIKPSTKRGRVSKQMFLRTNLYQAQPTSFHGNNSLTRMNEK